MQSLQKNDGDQEQHIYILMHQTVASHDAIGSDIELMYRILQRTSECWVFAENRINSHVPYLELDQFKEIVRDPSVVIIYHHSFYWELGFDLLKEVKGRIIFKYHNITPDSFFNSYNLNIAGNCRRGRYQTEQLQKQFPDAFWLSDSQYNAKELVFVPEERIGICPPLNKTEEWSRKAPDERLLHELIESSDFNILFVGRIAPNKGHRKLLEVLRAYCSYYGTGVKLRIIGKFDPSFSKYNNELIALIEEYGIGSFVQFIGEVNDNSLMSYYLGSDVFLCCSEHEGFCVPVAEAQYFGLPVVGMVNSAVPETIGNEQIILDYEPNRFAAALHLLKENSAIRNYVREKGWENFRNRFSYSALKKEFIKELSKGI